MSRRRDGRLRWPTSAAYGAIAVGWAAPGRPVSPRPAIAWWLSASYGPSCPVPLGSVRVGGWGRGEQAEGAGALDGLGTPVHAELGEEVAYVCPDRMH
jgi:hypothetical protein